MSKDSGLDEEKIGTLIDEKCRAATSWYSSKLSTEREKVTQYIDRKLPRPQHAGGSTFVTPHVYNAVEMMRAQLAETFSAGSGIVQFDALKSKDVQAARVASAYANHVFYVQNDGESLIRDVIYDGLTCRVGVAKVWWEKDEEEIPLDYANISEAEMGVWQQMDEIVEIRGEQDPMTGLYSGTIVITRDRGQVKIEAVNPEEFSIESHAKRLDADTFCVHRTEKTISWLLEQYPHLKGREDELGAGEQDDLSMAPEVLARFKDVDDYTQMDKLALGEEMREVMVYEAYAKFRRKGEPTAQLHRVLRCGKVTIEIEAVDRHPFLVFTALPRPHIFYGENFAKTVIPTQNAATASIRAIIDSAMIATNPRWMVAQGGLTNPRELLDNRLGGIVNVKSLESVAPLNNPQINPQLFSVIQGLNAMNEEITGITAMSQGLNKDVISTQNSASLMEQQLGVSQTRQKEIARAFATGFLIPLFTVIYDLVVQYERREDIEIVTDMGWTPIDPWNWRSGRTATASAHLGYGEKRAKAQELMMLGSQVSQNHWGQQFVGQKGEGAYAVLADVLTLMGHRQDIGRYLPLTPDQVQPPQPDPEKMAKVQHLQADAQARLITAKAMAGKVDQHGQLQDQKQQVQATETGAMLDLKKRDADRKDAEAQNRIHNSQIETALLVDAAAKGDEPAKAIISPNS